MADETTAPAEETPEESPQAIPDGVDTPEIDPEETMQMLTEGLAELLEMAEPAREFKGAHGTDNLTNLGGWTARQNKVAREIYKRVMKLVRETRSGGEKVSLLTIIDTLLDEENLWCDLFSIMYIPDTATRYDPEKAKEYRDDMLEMTNQLAVGALAFFITSSLSSIPRGILDFFRGMPMVGAVLAALEQQKRNAESASATASST